MSGKTMAKEMKKAFGKKDEEEDDGKSLFDKLGDALHGNRPKRKGGSAKDAASRAIKKRLKRKKAGY